MSRRLSTAGMRLEAAWFFMAKRSVQSCRRTPETGLLAEDKRLDVYAGELELRPPGAPTT